MTAKSYIDRNRVSSVLAGVGWKCDRCTAGGYWTAPPYESPEHVGCMGDAPLLDFMIQARDHLCGKFKRAPVGIQSQLFEVTF